MEAEAGEEWSGVAVGEVDVDGEGSGEAERGRLGIVCEESGEEVWSFTCAKARPSPPSYLL